MSRSPYGRLARSWAHARSVGAALALRVCASPVEWMCPKHGGAGFGYSHDQPPAGPCSGRTTGPGQPLKQPLRPRADPVNRERRADWPARSNGPCVCGMGSLAAHGEAAVEGLRECVARAKRQGDHHAVLRLGL